MAVSFRLAEPQDFSAIQDLWRENTNWGELSAQTFRERVVEAPLGGAVPVLVHDDDSEKLVGQLIFIPSILWIRGEARRAFRPAAPIVAKDWRSFGLNPLNHPVIRMYREGCALLKERGDALIYMVPSASWTRLFRMFSEFKVGQFPLYKLPVDADAGGLDPGVSFGEIDPSAKEIDMLWEKFRSLHPICVVRDSASLPWKLGGSGNQVVGIEKNGELIALLAMLKKGPQWLINDIMFADTSAALRTTMQVALHYGKLGSRESNGEIERISLLATPIMVPTLLEAGFGRDNYNFPLVVQPLSYRHEEGGELSPDHWFVSAGD